MHLKVTEEAVSKLLQLNQELNEIQSEYDQSIHALEQCFAENQQYLGYHSSKIGGIVDSLSEDKTLRKMIRRLRSKLQISASLRAREITNNPYPYPLSTRSNLLKALHGFQPSAEHDLTGCVTELDATKQGWTLSEDGTLVFNTPIETGEKLLSDQGRLNGYWGTCGIVSCANVLRLGGYPATEAELVVYASTTNSITHSGYLCQTNSDPDSNGGTCAIDRRYILKHYGVSSELREASVSNIAQAVSEGRGVIISVYPEILYYGKLKHHYLHAITVTSVKKDLSGNILGFYVCDSGTGGVDNSRYYTASQIEKALSGRKMNVTSIIR